MFPRTITSSLFLLALAGAAHAGVLVVGPGQAFTNLQAAVDAAADGDTLLVKPGTYSHAVINGKSLTIAGDGATRPVVQGAIQVLNLPAGGAVVVSRLNTSTYCASNAGEVRFADCELYSPQLIENDGSASFSGCSMRGWDIAGIGYSGADDGGPGLTCRGTRVTVYDSTLQGGRGGDDITIAGDGGHGLHLQASQTGRFTFAHISHSSLTGGRGGDTWEDIFQNFAFVGDGGSGLQGDLGTTAWIIDSTFTGGPRGAWHNCFPANYGSDGLPVAGNGRRTTFNADSVSMSGASLLRDNQTLTLDVHGAPGDEIWLFRGTSATFLAQASWRGAVLERWRHPQYDPIAPYAVLDGTGHATITLPLLPVDPGAAQRIFLQPYRVHSNGTLTVGSVLPVTVVDATY